MVPKLKEALLIWVFLMVSLHVFLEAFSSRAISHSRIRNGMACVKWERGTYERVGDRESKLGKISVTSVLRRKEYGIGGLGLGSGRLPGTWDF